MKFKKVIPVFLFLVFALAITPEQLIHHITGHVDTTDTFHSDKQLSTKHIHCQSLQLTLPSFVKTEKIQPPFFQYFNATSIVGNADNYHFVKDVHLPSRAPPALS